MHVIIIGNGISGITAARHIRKRSDYRITVISKESEYFFSRTALMYIYMGHMKFEDTQPYENWFWKKNRIDLVHDEVTQIEPKSKSITLSEGKILAYDKLIIACGSKPNKFGWSGQHLDGVQGLYSKQDLENMEIFTKDIQRAVIVGGGLIGVEMAEMLSSREIPVTFLVREQNFWDNALPMEEAIMIGKHITEHHIDLRLSTQLAEILPDASGRVQAVVTDQQETIRCQFVGLTAGVSPAIDFLKSSGIECRRGVLVNNYFETNQQDVYAIGDCAEFTNPLPDRTAVEQVWYTGRMMGETIASTICGQRKAYQPGIWFNSAKFFDVEYQTYGWVLPTISNSQASFFWKHATEKICLRINYEKDTLAVRGVNVFGIRLRHETMDAWIHEKRSITYLLEHLAEANFDPEFCRQHEAEIIQHFNQQNPHSTLKLKSKRGLFKKISG